MRLVTIYEAHLIRALLIKNPQYSEEIIPKINTLLVENMNDGGMGGLLFISPDPDSDRIFGKIIAEAEFTDEDGILVSIALSLDTSNQLFELDVWKIDYSPVYKWPDLDKIVIKGV
jgi:phosphomannomutase